MQGGKDKKAAAKAAALAKASAGKAAEKKPAPVERTQCVYEVKPAEAGQDMADLEAKVRSVKKEGLSWGEQFKVVDVAYGIQKLIIQFLVDERCGLQDVEDAVRVCMCVCVFVLCVVNHKLLYVHNRHCVLGLHSYVPTLIVLCTRSHPHLLLALHLMCAMLWVAQIMEFGEEFVSSVDLCSMNRL